MNDTVTFKCHFESEVTGALFAFPNGNDCRWAACEKPLCISTVTNYSCVENKTFEMTIIVLDTWNNKTVHCEAAFGGNTSNSITMTVKGRFTTMEYETSFF